MVMALFAAKANGAQGRHPLGYDSAKPAAPEPERGNFSGVAK
jgi:hypothetical protein